MIFHRKAVSEVLIEVASAFFYEILRSFSSTSWSITYFNCSSVNPTSSTLKSLNRSMIRSKVSSMCNLSSSVFLSLERMISKAVDRWPFAHNGWFLWHSHFYNQHVKTGLDLHSSSKHKWRASFFPEQRMELWLVLYWRISSWVDFRDSFKSEAFIWSVLDKHEIRRVK